MKKITLDTIFKPTSVAVIGASTSKDAIGRVILHNIITNDFKGTVFPVNPKTPVINSIKCYPSVSDIPDPVDLAIIIIGRDYVKNVVEECGKLGIKAVVVITSGFKEVGPEGAKKEKELLAITKKYGMRMVGPNCFGVLNTDPEISLNATFSKQPLRRGNIGFVSQSGALGEAILDYAKKLHLGFSMFSSVGNKADISGNDLLTYWENDPDTEVILLYLENFGNPRNFTRIAQRITRKKPIIAVKAGRTSAGARAISSHTGALASIEVGIDAFFNQCGVLRVTTVNELFDLASAFANQPIPKGDRIAIVTNAGGPGILATDAIVSLGLKIAKFSEETISVLRANLDKAAAVKNPIDVIASGGPQEYKVAIEAMFQDPNVDAILIIFVPTVFIDKYSVAKAIGETVSKYENSKTVLSCFMGDPETEFRTAGKYNIPIYTFPESAAKALSAMVKHSHWQQKEDGKFVRFKGDKQRVRQIIKEAKQQKSKVILGHEALQILDAYDIPVSNSIPIKNLGELKRGMKKLGLPLALKVVSPEMIHKTDVGGVKVNLRSEERVIATFDQMKQKFSSSAKSFLMQEMVKGNVETVLGMQRDPTFGPLMMFGLGGIYVEVMKDVTFKIHPITDLDAQEMVASIKGSPLLVGFRGAKPVDIDILKEVILRLAQLADDFPQFESFDINPFFAAPDATNSKAVDARFVLGT